MAHIEAPAVHYKHWDEVRSEICTLFVAGLPDDVKPREIHNLFCRHHGFKSSLLQFTGSGIKPVAYVAFSTHQAAVAAMIALSGFVFDIDAGKKLFIELARSNSCNTAPDCGPYQVIDKRIRKKDNEPLEETQTQCDLDRLSGMEEPEDRSKDGCPDSNLEVSTEKSTEIESKMRKGGHSFHEKTEMQPCTSLCIANLDWNFCEKELNEVLSKYPRFQTLKCLRRTQGVLAFANFEDIESSTEALNGLHGTSLPSSVSGAMHVEYAGRKRQPCTTLCIANLHQSFCEEELNEVLSKYPRFKKLKYLKGKGLAFADFQDIESSTEALNGLHGTYLPSSIRGPMCVEYSWRKRQPCTTLCITNLHRSCCEEELNEVLSKYPRFKNLKYLKGNVFAYADFQDIESSTEALNGLHGTYLPSSDCGPMNVEYAWYRM